MVENPFGYIVQRFRDGDVLASGPTLKEAVTGLESPDSGFEWFVTALVGTTRVRVPREAYLEFVEPSHDEALTFIRDRAAKIASSLNPATSFYRASGCMRCNCDDPEDKQVIDYIKSAPWKVRDTPDENWWVT